jgi:hypothetical protein
MVKRKIAGLSGTRTTDIEPLLNDSDGSGVSHRGIKYIAQTGPSIKGSNLYFKVANSGGGIAQSV